MNWFQNFIDKLRKTYKRSLRLRGDPREIARGMAIGVFFGVMPIFGFQMGVSVVVAALFRSSIIAAATGSLITNPLTTPFIYTLAYYLGNSVLTAVNPDTRSYAFEFSMLFKMWEIAPDIILAITLGSIMIAIPSSITGYFISLHLIRQYRQQVKEKLAQQRQKLAEKRIKIVKKSEQLRETLRSRKAEKEKRESKYKS